MTDVIFIKGGANVALFEGTPDAAAAQQAVVNATTQANNAATSATNAAASATAASNQATIASNAVANLSQISQTLGRQANPVAGTNIAANTYVNGTPAAATGVLSQIRVYGWSASGGTVIVRRFTLSGSTFTQIGTDTNITVGPASAGLQTIPVSIAVNAGEYIGFYSPANIIAITTGTTQDPGGYYKPATAGNVTTLTTASTVASTVRIQIAFDITTQYVTIARLQADEAQIATNTAAATLNSAAVANLQTASVIGWDPPGAGNSGSIGNTAVLGTPLSDPSIIKQVRLYSYAGMGPNTLIVRRFVLSGSNFVQTGTDTSVSVQAASAGLQTIPLNISANKGDYIGFYIPPNGLAISTGISNGGNYFAASGNVTTVPTSGAGSSSARFEAAFDIQVQTVNATRWSGVSNLAYLPLYTDGRHLFQWFSALAKRMQSGTGKARIMVAGDSRAERLQIVQQLANLLYAAYGQAGGGWISVDSDRINLVYPLDGATFTRSAGWTLYDASNGGAPPTQGCAFDGHLLYSTGTSQTATITFTGTNCDIHYSKTDGTFRYQVDGGSWVSVTGDNSNSLGVASISGLSNALHTVNIDQGGNTGTTAIRGFHFYNAAGIGVEVQKGGNGSITAAQTANYSSAYVGPGLAQLTPDVIVFICDVNDAIANESITTFQASIRQWITAASAVLPNVGFVLIATAESGYSGSPLVNYRNALADIATTDGHEFYNMHDDWSSYAVENANGMYLDTLHPSDAGGYRIASRLFNKLLKL